jgi:protoheme IX farnesyltransferase
VSAGAAYLALTKPRLLPLVLFSGLPALVIAAGGWPGTGLAAATLLGTAIVAGAANALNSYLERDRDALMERTRTRPLPAGALRPAQALGFGLALAALGTALLWRATGAPAALIALGAVLCYVFVYTLWLKPRTPFAVVAGGVAGAIAPLIADAAVDGTVGAGGWLLFAIVFVWQPPHFYAISLHRLGDYRRAGFPTLADRAGERSTCNRIVAWIATLVAITLVTPLWTPLGWLYTGVAAGLGAWLLARAWRLRQRGGAHEAWRFFRATLVYLVVIFGAMIADLALGLGVQR